MGSFGVQWLDDGGPTRGLDSREAGEEGRAGRAGLGISNGAETWAVTRGKRAQGKWQEMTKGMRWN